MQLNRFAANVMADVFIDQRDDEGNITAKCGEIIKDVFGDVPPESRADTYIAFLEVLDSRGFEYSLDEIQSIQ